MTTEDDREIKFVFDDDEADMMEGIEAVSESEEIEYEKAQTAALIQSIQDGLKTAQSLEEFKKLNDQLVGLQSEILSLNNSRLVQDRNERNKDVFRMIQTAECVDLCFVIDATNSMKNVIRTVKDNIRHIVREINRTNPNLKLRLAMVVYRDLHYKEHYNVLDFVESIKRFEDFVCEIKTPHAQVKRDIPEDMATGILHANLLSWSQPTRITFIVADNPCHGFEFHNFQDNYPLGTPGVDIKKELRVLMGHHDDKGGTMTVYFGTITNGTKTMIKRFKHYGIFLMEVNFRLQQNVVESVVKGVRSSVFKTVSTLQTTKDIELLRRENEEKLIDTKPLARREYTIVDRELVEDEWRVTPTVQVIVYKNRPITLTAIQELVSIGRLKGVKTLRRAPAPFAEGSTRIAFHGLLYNQSADAAYPVVLKSFRFMGLSMNDRKHYLRQMEVSNLSSFLAEKFNHSSARPPRCGYVRVLKVCVLEEEGSKKQDANKQDDESDICRFCLEKPLPTDGSKFTRFNNNTGYWDENELNETLLQFTKYTYAVTGGYLLVTDLQGVRRGNDYFLTDPVILCKNPLRFGGTNVGVDFMKRCVKSADFHLKANGWFSSL